MGLENPKQLINAVFYYCGLSLCLQGGEEYQGLQVSQFERKVVMDPDCPDEETVCYEYTAKIIQGGLKPSRIRLCVLTLVVKSVNCLIHM